MNYQIYNDPVPAVDSLCDGVSTVLCPSEAPSVLFTMLRKKGSALRGEQLSNPLFRIDKKTPTVELSVLNAGTIFDIKLPVVSNTLIAQVTEAGTLWTYIPD